MLTSGEEGRERRESKEDGSGVGGRLGLRSWRHLGSRLATGGGDGAASWSRGAPGADGLLHRPIGAARWRRQWRQQRSTQGAGGGGRAAWAHDRPRETRFIGALEAPLAKARSAAKAATTADRWAPGGLAGPERLRPRARPCRIGFLFFNFQKGLSRLKKNCENLDNSFKARKILWKSQKFHENPRNRLGHEQSK
jgi:hypothetical protein